MMAVKHVPIGWDVIETIVMTNCRRLPRAIDPERPIGDEQPIKPIGDSIDANRGDNQPRGGDRFTAIERYDRKCYHTQKSNREP